MRITRETLIRVAKETAQKQALSDRSLVAAYLTGSLLTSDPFLGNATDVDIVFVHTQEPKVRREILPLTPEVHLDICHNPRSLYDKTKELRVHPWLGPELYDPLPLYVTQHFFEFVQAGVRDRYTEPASALTRATREAEAARLAWTDLQHGEATGPDQLLAYLNGLHQAANAVALLAGDPLSERRLMLQFPSRAEAAGRPEITRGLFALLGAPLVDTAALSGFLLEWEKAFVDATGRPRVDARIASPRLGYYKLAFESLLMSASPQAILWPLLITWTLAVSVLPPTRKAKWQVACEQLGFSAGAFPEKLEALDAFIDTVDELLEDFSSRNNL